MKIAKVIKYLNHCLKNGLEYVSTDDLGGCHLICSKDELNDDSENHVYVTILNPEFRESEREFTIKGEGKDYAHIKCKVIATRIRLFDEKLSDGYECVLDVEPVEELPKWYVRDEEEDIDYYSYGDYGDFRSVSIHDINRRLGSYKIEIPGVEYL